MDAPSVADAGSAARDADAQADAANAANADVVVSPADAGPELPPGTCISDVDAGCECQAGMTCSITCAKGPCTINCTNAKCDVTCNDDCNVKCGESSTCTVKNGNCSASGTSTCSSS